MFLCPFGKSGHRCKTHMGVSGNVNRTNHELMISVPHERQFQGICVCVFFHVQCFRRWATEKCFFCSPLGLGFGPFNFPQFPTTSIISDSIWENGKQNKARAPIFQLPVNFFHNFIPDGPRLTKSLHLRGFPSSLRLCCLC